MNEITSPSTLIEQVDYNGKHFGNLTWLISPDSGSKLSYASARNKIKSIANHLKDKGPYLSNGLLLILFCFLLMHMIILIHYQAISTK